MHIYCKGFCYLCGNPLKIYMKSNNYEVRELIRKYKRIKPLWLYNNECFYKLFGSQKIKRTCYSCFKHLKKPNIEKLRNREIGKTNKLTIHPLSLSKNEILLWYEGLKRYIKREFKNRPIMIYNNI